MFSFFLQPLCTFKPCNILIGKNVKSVVWPPPNPPEDEPPKILGGSNTKTVCEKTRSEAAPVIEPPKCINKVKTEAFPISNMPEASTVQSISTSQQMAEYSTSASYNSASMSTATTSSSQSESLSVVESKQSELVKSEMRSCTVQSFTEQAISECQMSTMYQSQTSPPIEKTYENPMCTIENKIESNSMMRTESETKSAAEIITQQADLPVKSLENPTTQTDTKIEAKTRRESLTKRATDIVTEKADAPVETVFDNLMSKTDNIMASMSQSMTRKESATKSSTEIVTTETALPSEKSFDNSVGMRENTIESKSMVRRESAAETTTQVMTEQSFQENRRESLVKNQTTTIAEAKVDRMITEQPSVNNAPSTDKPIPNSVDISPVPKEENFNHVQNPEPSAKKSLPPTSISNSVPKGFAPSMVDALTIASDRPYSPLPTPQVTNNLLIQSNMVNENLSTAFESQNITQPPQEPQKMAKPPQPSPMFSQVPKRGITPIPPIKTYNPPEKKDQPIPMPPETQPYIPPDFKIIIEPKVPRKETSSPMIEALTTAPDRPFTPVNNVPSIERGSLKEALTIAPDRSYSPLPLNVTNKSTHYTSTSTIKVQSTSSEIVRPIATQSTTQMTHSEVSNMQNTCKLQSSSEMSAFRPVPKQVFPPPQPEEFCMLTDFPPMTQEFKANFENSVKRQEAIITESQMMQHSSNTFSNTTTQGFSSVKSAQSFFEQLDQRETMSSVAVRSKSGLHKPDNIPPYQKHFEHLPSQRGITPEICSAPAVLQRPVTPTTNPPVRPKDKSVEPKLPPANTISQQGVKIVPQIKTPVQQNPPPVHFHKDAPISMTFQPVTDEHFLRASPARSRPTTPSMINKPAPIIPYYQMNLVSVEHLAPDTHLYEPSSPEASRSPTPRMRSKSPAQGPPPNPLKAQEPRIKESTPQRHTSHSLLTQATSNLRKEHEIAQKGFQSGVEVFNASGAKNWGQDQPSVIREQKHSNVGFKSETYNKGAMNIKEDSMINQNYGQRQTESQNVSEYGNTTVQTSRKTYEEFERTQSAKVIQIQKGGSSSYGAQQQIDSNVRTSINSKQVFPPPVMSLSSSQQNSSVNLTNKNVVAAASRNIENCYPNPSISGANQDPVCDPTPSTGSSIGAAARGKAFGVSSAPKRGRGVLNKAALPGSRVPLCGSCNGNIR